MTDSPAVTAFIALVRKDLWLWAANRRSVILGVIAPVLIAAFFGYLFDPKRGGGSSRIPVAVTDLDGSRLSAQVLAGLQGDAALEIRTLDEAAAASAVTEGRVRAAIVLPAGFGRQAPAALFGPGTKPEVLVRYDPSQAMVLPMVRGLLAQHVMGPVFGGLTGGDPASSAAVVQPLRDALARAGAGPDAGRRQDLQALLDSLTRLQQSTASAQALAPAGAASAPAGQGLALPFTTRELAATARLGQDYNSYAHSFAGMGVQFILLMGIDVGIGLLLARRMGLWQRLRAAPIGMGLLLASRMASAALIAFGLLMAIFATAALLFGVRIEGSATGFVGVGLAFALLTASFGLLIAAIGRTPEATRGLAVLLTLLLVMLGGAWAPSFIFPPWLQQVSLLTPTRWAVDGLDAVTWRGQGLLAVLPQIGGLLAASAAFTLLALWRFAALERSGRD